MNEMHHTPGHRLNPGRSAEPVLAGLHRMSERAESAAKDAGLTPILIELVKLRASQINGCAYCLELHTKVATAAGERPERLAVVAAWRETDWFSEEEEAALELTEWVTRISEGTPDDDAYERLVSTLGEEKYSAVFWVATVINSYNRLAITSHHHVGPES